MYKAAAPVITPEGQKATNNSLGIVLMLAGFFMFSMADVTAKYLTAEFHVVQIAWARMSGLLVVVLLLVSSKGIGIFRTAHPFLQVARGAAAVVSSVLFIIAVGFVPLADAVAVTFVAPLMVTILAAFVLREKVGIRRWIAVLIGFLATLLIIRPGAGVVHPAILLILGAALFFAFRQIISRALSGSDRTQTTLAYTALVASLILLVPLPFFWKTPQETVQIGLFVLLAVASGMGELLVIRALEIGEAVALAPMHYSLIIWGTFYGWLIFSQLPDMWTLTGAAIIVMTGIYIIQREALANRRRRQEAAGKSNSTAS